MSLDDTKTVRVSNDAHNLLTETAEKNHVSVAFLIDFMLGRCQVDLRELFDTTQKMKAMIKEAKE